LYEPGKVWVRVQAFKPACRTPPGQKKREPASTFLEVSGPMFCRISATFVTIKQSKTQSLPLKFHVRGMFSLKNSSFLRKSKVQKFEKEEAKQIQLPVSSSFRTIPNDSRF
jgi:hypothetical protein